MDLDQYLWQFRIKKVDFARELGIARGYLHHLISRQRQPSRKLAEKIITASLGRITMGELIDEDLYKKRPYKKKA